MTYQNKSKRESKLQERVEQANLSNDDFRNMFWQLWGACFCHKESGDLFYDLVSHYLSKVGK